MVERHNADLANGLGNLASRVLAMLASNFDGVVPAFTVAGAESDLPSVTDEAAERYQAHMERVELSPALTAAWEIVARANHYLVEKEPWKIKDEARRDELASILYASAETLRILAVLDLPDHAARRRAPVVAAGHPASRSRNSASRRPPSGAASPPGPRPTKGESLFPRLDTE